MLTRRPNTNNAQARHQAGAERQGNLRRSDTPSWSLILLVLLRRLGSVLPHLSHRNTGHDTLPAVHHRRLVDSWLRGNSEGVEMGSMGRPGSLSTSDSGPRIRSDDRPAIPRGSLKQHCDSLHCIACDPDVLCILDFPSRSRQEKELQVAEGASRSICAGILLLLESGFISLAFVA